MKTLTELKAMIDYQQTDDVFLDFLSQLHQRGLIHIKNDDIQAGGVSEGLFHAVTILYGTPKQEIEDDAAINQ